MTEEHCYEIAETDAGLAHCLQAADQLGNILHEVWVLGIVGVVLYVLYLYIAEWAS